MSPNSHKNRENASGPKIKLTKKDSRSVDDLRDTTGRGSYTLTSVACQKELLQSVITTTLVENEQKICEHTKKMQAKFW